MSNDNWLKSFGFEAGETVLHFTPNFTVAELREAHYGSTYDDPKPLRLTIGEDFVLPVVVEMTRAVYEAMDNGVYDFISRNLGCYRYPSWYGEGWLFKSGFDPYREVVRVRFYLVTDLGGMFEDGYVQRIPDTPDPDGDIQFLKNIKDLDLF
jgi:hypothetical protein